MEISFSRCMSVFGGIKRDKDGAPLSNRSLLDIQDFRVFFTGFPAATETSCRSHAKSTARGIYSEGNLQRGESTPNLQLRRIYSEIPVSSNDGIKDIDEALPSIEHCLHLRSEQCVHLLIFEFSFRPVSSKRQAYLYEKTHRKTFVKHSFWQGKLVFISHIFIFDIHGLFV